MDLGCIKSGGYKIMAMPDITAKLYQAVSNVRSRKPSLKVAIALGGWSPMILELIHRYVSVWLPHHQNLLGFLVEYGFDGAGFD
jgi:hypothetical protein